MKAKSITAIALTVVLLFSMVTAGFAASFPDLETRHAWAKEAVDSMASRGILKGFPDGKFQPDTPITKLDSLIIMARMLGYINEDNGKYKDAAVEAYANTLSGYNINYKGEVAYLLYWGVIRTDELDRYIGDTTKSTPLLRHEAAILLTKLMGGEAEAKSNTLVVLDYADAASIPAASQAYVHYVGKNGIMNGVENNQFSPSAAVNRAMMATMMYRAGNKMDLRAVDVKLVSVNQYANTMEAELPDGIRANIDVADSTRYVLDGKPVTMNNMVVGANARLYYVAQGYVRFVEQISTDLSFVSKGKIQATGTTGDAKTITLLDDTTGKMTALTVASGCVFTVDGVASSFGAMQQGLYIEAEVSGGKIVRITAETKAKDYVGTITAVNVGSLVSLDVKLSGGSSVSYSFSDNAVIKRNGATAEAWSLAAGDGVTFTVMYGKITLLTATSKSRNTTGTIEAITISSTPSVTVKESSGSQVYAVNSTTTFTVDGKENGTIYDLRLGGAITLKVEGSTVVNITTQSVVQSPVVVGTVEYIHPTSNVMGISVVNADGSTTTVQTIVKGTVKITDATNTKITTFKGITVGRSVVAVGTMNYGVYEINAITITE